MCVKESGGHQKFERGNSSASQGSSREHNKKGSREREEQGKEGSGLKTSSLIPRAADFDAAMLVRPALAKGGCHAVLSAQAQSGSTKGKHPPIHGLLLIFIKRRE
jgi:hypothetical protein